MKTKLKLNYILVFVILALVSVFAYQNCGRAKYTLNGSITNALESVHGTGTTSTINPEDTVCDPQPPTVIDDRAGLAAELYYLQPRPASGTADYISNFFIHTSIIKSPAALFYNQINVPTQMFDKGFLNSQGDYLKTLDGSTLVEYFGLKYSGSFVVKTVAEEGDYQFALLSDDGAALELFVNNTWDQFLINDYISPTKMACSIKTVHLQKDQAIPLRYYYFQGPATQIANILMWRKVTPGNVTLDPECNQYGNDYFFTSSTSAPTQVWTNLLSRGWEIVPMKNLIIPGSIISNPCVPRTTTQPR